MFLARNRSIFAGAVVVRASRVLACSRSSSQYAGGWPCPKEYDMVGPADPKSNIRKMAFARRPQETLREQGFRMTKENTYSWHQEFWTKHNENFNQSKKEFLKGKEKKSEKESADELSLFYKEFLDNNYQLHKQYQWEWYKKNVSMVWPSIQILFSRLAKYVLWRTNR